MVCNYRAAAFVISFLKTLSYKLVDRYAVYIHYQQNTITANERDNLFINISFPFSWIFISTAGHYYVYDASALKQNL